MRDAQGAAAPRFEQEHVVLDGHRLEIQWFRPERERAGAAPIVLLHEGLGSVAMWRDFPQRLAEAAGSRVLAYSRLGYGSSDPLQVRRNVRYMHGEALVTLPRLLDALGIERPVLLGHSDGASIALICAGGTRRELRGVIVMAPHVMVEPITIGSIEQAREAFRDTDLRQRLARYHDDVDSAFLGWNEIWLDPAFRAWNIEEYLPGLHCPVLAIQGEDDEYGSMEQLERIARYQPAARLLKLARCRHSPHRDQPEAVLKGVCQFLASIEGER